MSDVVIKVENLYKEYRLGTISHGTLYKDLQSWWARVRGKEDPNSIISTMQSSKAITASKPFTLHPSRFTDSENPHMLALNDVSFEVKKGDVLGIIGRNGAGKSTLLKILSEVTSPTKGQVKIKGRVASLLEVGTGFHPELTGRENIFLNGAILGMTKKEIAKKFDEIVSFAEIEKFIDTPVKRYSSGMYVRLAFAVAAHLEPEILIVDEVLAVGDAQFQKKCLGKMGDVAKEGRTVLFVSHNMTALQTLCDRAIWLSSGHVVNDGNAGKVVASYLQNGGSTRLEQYWDDPHTAPGNDKVRFHRVNVMADEDTQTGIMTVDTPIKILFEFRNYVAGAYLSLSMVLYDQQDVCIFNTSSEAKHVSAGLVQGVCHIPGNLLNDSTYRVRILIVQDASFALLDIDNVAMFEVQDIPRQGNWYGKWIGAVRPKLKWSINSI